MWRINTCMMYIQTFASQVYTPKSQNKAEIFTRDIPPHCHTSSCASAQLNTSGPDSFWCTAGEVERWQPSPWRTHTEKERPRYKIIRMRRWPEIDFFSSNSRMLCVLRRDMGVRTLPRINATSRPWKITYIKNIRCNEILNESIQHSRPTLRMQNRRRETESNATTFRCVGKRTRRLFSLPSVA